MGGHTPGREKGGLYFPETQSCGVQLMLGKIISEQEGI